MFLRVEHARRAEVNKKVDDRIGIFSEPPILKNCSEIGLPLKSDFLKLSPPLFMRGVVFARDSPHFLTLYGMKLHITGKSIIL